MKGGRTSEREMPGILQAAFGRAASDDLHIWIMIHPHGAVAHRNGNGGIPVEPARAVRLFTKMLNSFYERRLMIERYK